MKINSSAHSMADVIPFSVFNISSKSNASIKKKKKLHAIKKAISITFYATFYK